MGAKSDEGHDRYRAGTKKIDDSLGRAIPCISFFFLKGK